MCVKQLRACFGSRVHALRYASAHNNEGAAYTHSRLKVPAPLNQTPTGTSGGQPPNDEM
jgi:hypothetical protein